jgi:hypothetical protein
VGSGSAGRPASRRDHHEFDLFLLFYFWFAIPRVIWVGLRTVPIVAEVEKCVVQNGVRSGFELGAGGFHRGSACQTARSYQRPTRAHYGLEKFRNGITSKAAKFTLASSGHRARRLMPVPFGSAQPIRAGEQWLLRCSDRAGGRACCRSERRFRMPAMHSTPAPSSHCRRLARLPAPSPGSTSGRPVHA